MAVERGNIFLSNTAETMPFASRPGIGSASYPSRDRGSHASYVRGKLLEAFEADKEQKSAAAFRHKEGVYLEFSGSPEHQLAIRSLENRRLGIRLLNVREEKTGAATVIFFCQPHLLRAKRMDQRSLEQNPFSEYRCCGLHS